MDPFLRTWSDVEPDFPIELLERRRVSGEQALLAMVKLSKGCIVAVHSHPSEQFAVVLSGKVRWTLGAEGSPDRRTLDVVGGQVLTLPSNFPHGVEALEDTQILDILAPPGAMGVDSQRA